MEKKPITPLAAGLIIGLTSVVLFLVYYFTGLIFQTKGGIRFIPSLIYFILVIVFIVAWSNSKNNFVSYGNCFGFGFKVTCIVTLISFFSTALFVYLEPDFKTQMLQVAKEQMRENKALSDDQIDKGIETFSGIFAIYILGVGLFFNMIIGTIAALIGAAVAKKKPFDPFTQINQIGEPQP